MKPEDDHKKHKEITLGTNILWDSGLTFLSF